MKALAYDVQNDPGKFVADATGPFFYQEFDVDISGLAAGYGVHFDLYTKDSEGSREEFAPFSHDAEISVVPLPAATLLGLLGLGTAGIKLRRMV